MQNLFGVKGELDEDQIAQLLMESGPNIIIEIPEETRPGCLSGVAARNRGFWCVSVFYHHLACVASL